jgi:hypothetical protein
MPLAGAGPQIGFKRSGGPGSLVPDGHRQLLWEEYSTINQLRRDEIDT